MLKSQFIPPPRAGRIVAMVVFADAVVIACEYEVFTITRDDE